MIELETPQRKASELPAEIASRRSGRGAFRRRSATRVLVISGFILLTVWGLRYAGEAGEVFRSAAENGQSRPWGHVLDPWFIAKTCPQALMSLLAAVVGFYLFLRLKSVRPLERLILETLSQPATDGKSRPSQSWTWIALGLATVAAALAILEWIEPCYFVQDDNFAGGLPAILHGCRSIFQGEFPDFDPCQLMGVPSAAARCSTRPRSFPMLSPAGGWGTSTTRWMSLRQCTCWRATWRRMQRPGPLACGRPWPTCWGFPSCSAVIFCSWGADGYLS